MPLPCLGMGGRMEQKEGAGDKQGTAALLSGPGGLAASAASHDCQKSVKNLPKATQ